MGKRETEVETSQFFRGGAGSPNTVGRAKGQAWMGGGGLTPHGDSQVDVRGGALQDEPSG